MVCNMDQLFYTGENLRVSSIILGYVFQSIPVKVQLQQPMSDGWVLIVSEEDMFYLYVTTHRTVKV